MSSSSMRAVGYFVLISPLARPGSGLWCFRCSKFEPGSFDSECPAPDQAPTEWVKNSNKFFALQDRVDSDLACAVVYDGGEGKVFHQSGGDQDRCNDGQYRTKMFTNLAQTSEGTGDARLQCCTSDGCNWNGTMARRNLGFAEFTNTTVDAGDGFMDERDVVPFVLIGVVLATVLFCLCCFCCIWCANKRKEEHEATQKLYDLYGSYNSNMMANGLRNSRSWSVTGGRGRNFDRASQKGNRGTRRIIVSGAPNVEVMDPKDHERYSAVERRLYKRHSRASSDDSSRSTSGASRRRRRNSRQGRRVGEGGSGSGRGRRSSSAEPYDDHNKNRISKVSRNVFDNDDFRAAHKTETSDRQKQPKKYEKMQDWQHVWEGNADVNRDRLVRGGNANAFSYNSA